MRISARPAVLALGAIVLVSAAGFAGLAQARAAAAAAAEAAAAQAEAQADAIAAERASREALPDEALKEAMHQMEQALESLGKGVKADNRDDALATLAKFEAAVMSAKEKTPPSAAKVEEKKRAAFVADYRKTLVEGLQFACAAELAILDGKYKEADTLIRNKLGGLKSAGHGKFKQDGGPGGK